MITITVEDMQRDLPEYLKRVNEGETVVILQGNTPVAELKPVPALLNEPRPFGLCAGQFTVPTDFDAPLPEDVIADFEGR